eukprot:355821-Chlamydomonas_euryale.AAC.11
MPSKPAYCMPSMHASCMPSHFVQCPTASLKPVLRRHDAAPLCADNFFGSPEINEAVTIHAPKKCRAGCLAMRVPDPPKYAPPTICNISKDGKIAAIGGRDVELYLWDTTTGGLLATLRGHEICWTSSYDHTFFVTVQEDSKVRGMSRVEPKAARRHRACARALACTSACW